MTIIEYAKVMEHQCSSIEELLMRVHDECEVRGYTAAKTIEVAEEVRAWYTQTQDSRAGMRDAKVGVYDKFYRYNRKDDGAAYDKGWQRAVNNGSAYQSNNNLQII